MSESWQIPSHARRFSEIWNLPNVLTYGRIVAYPWLRPAHVGGQHARWVALAIFVAAAVTIFSMASARKWQQQSSLGVMLDPIADKVW